MAIVTSPRNMRRTSKLDQLSEKDRVAVFEYCDPVSLSEGARWLKEEYQISVCIQSLSNWLARQRIMRGIFQPRKICGDTRLESLTDDQKSDVLARCERAKRDGVVKWLEAEYGVKTSTEELGRWLRRHRHERASAQSPNLSLAAEEREQAKLAEGVKWLERKFQIKISPQSLSSWLKAQRALQGIKERRERHRTAGAPQP